MACQFSLADHNKEKRGKVEGFEGAGEFQARLLYRTSGGPHDEEEISIDQLIALADYSDSCRQFIMVI